MCVDPRERPGEQPRPPNDAQHEVEVDHNPVEQILPAIMVGCDLEWFGEPAAIGVDDHGDVLIFVRRTDSETDALNSMLAMSC